MAPSRKKILLMGVVAIAAFAAMGTFGTVQAADELPPGGTFTDDNGNLHEGNIEAIHVAGIANGCAPTLYCPDGLVTREQMAAFIDRALDLPTSAVDWFSDDANSNFEDEINSLADVGITLGCEADRFCPTGHVTRAEMASFLVRAFGLQPDTTDHFDDDDVSSHEPDINALAGAEVTLGCGAGRYCPSQPVLRSQMASFLARVIGLAPLVPPPSDLSGIWVDTAHGSASDTNAGTQQAPLKTIQEAVDRTDILRKAGSAARIIVVPGVYRERIHLRWIGENPPPLTIEAAPGGTVRVTGTDVWAGWTPSGDGIYSAPWPFNWGATSGVEEIVGRREVAFHNGNRLQQVLSFSALQTGTFFVDEQADRVHVSIGGSAPATVEIGVRERVMLADGAQNVSVRGLEFSGAPSPFDTPAVRITNVSNFTFIDNTIRNNSWVGMSIATSNGVVLRGNRMNENGGGGLGVYKVPSLQLLQNETSSNNWRGVRGGFIGWSIAGVKAVGSHGLLVDGHRSIGNQTRGFWVDHDIANFTVSNSTFCDNLTDGLFIEAAQGPSTVADTTLCNNGKHGLLISNGRTVTVTGSNLCGNGKSALRLETDRPEGRTINTASGSITLSGADHLTFTGNVLGGSPRLFDSNLPSSHWASLVDTIQSDMNVFSTGTTTFYYEQGERTLADWQATSGQDGSSSLASGGCWPRTESLDKPPWRTTASRYYLTGASSRLRGGIMGISWGNGISRAG